MFRRIGTKLYVALGLAVMLTLLSSGVGVYYFELSGDLNHGLAREQFPAYRAAWEVAEGAALLSSAGEREFERAARGDAPSGGGSVGDLAEPVVAGIRDSLSRPAGLDGVDEQAGRVLESAWTTFESLDALDVLSPSLVEVHRRSRELGLVMAEQDDGGEVWRLLRSARVSGDGSELDERWAAYEGLVAGGGVPSGARELAEGDDGVFAVRESLLVLDESLAAARSDFEEQAGALELESAALLDVVAGRFGGALEGSLTSFDRGRVLLFGISAASVAVATLVAWLWVGNMVVRRLSRLSTRMRSMAGGDLDAPVPEVGTDEIGQLAAALEVFRQQAIEVQRLNLVERLYGELRQAYQELGEMQERLVAREKLAALGEIVSGVAHEVSNPLSFVKNFAEGSGELADELFEMLDDCGESIGEDDRATMGDIRRELSESLERVRVNGNRALTIVHRMQSLGVVGGEPEMADLHPALRRAVQLGCDTFSSEWGDFSLEPEFLFAPDVSRVSMVPMDFNEAVVNLVTNACYAMRVRRESGEGGYEPCLAVSSELREDCAAIMVWDNGCGIADDVLPRIFDPFFTTRDGALGAGLGLPLAADVARRCGGDLAVETEAGAWSRFTLTLPLRVPPSAVAALDERYDGDLSTVRAFGAAT